MFLVSDPNGGEVMLKVFDGVLLDFMLFQKAIEFVARADAQQRTELLTGDAPQSVGFESNGLQRGTIGVLAGQQGRSEIVGDFQSNLHALSVA